MALITLRCPYTRALYRWQPDKFPTKGPGEGGQPSACIHGIAMSHQMCARPNRISLEPTMLACAQALGAQHEVTPSPTPPLTAHVPACTVGCIRIAVAGTCRCARRLRTMGRLAFHEAHHSALNDAQCLRYWRLGSCSGDGLRCRIGRREATGARRQNRSQEPVGAGMPRRRCPVLPAGTPSRYCSKPRRSVCSNGCRSAAVWGGRGRGEETASLEHPARS